MKNERNRLSIDIFHKNNIKGQNVNVAVIDTGIKAHLDFVLVKNRIIEFWDVQKGNVMPYDVNGHGTAVCGILAGCGLISGGKFAGIAPNANIIGVKAISDDGIGDTKSILEGMHYVSQNKDRLDIRVVCMSFGSEPEFPDPIMRGAEILWNQGIVVVASGGNDGPNSGTIRSPGATPSILTVGGVDWDINDVPFVVDFSSRGPWRGFSRPDIVAPAVNITTTGVQSHYTVMSGTSMSAPMIAGIVALMLCMRPKLNPNKIKEILLSSATFVDNDKNASGWGLVDVDKVFKQFLSADSTV
ncbi:MAG: S8 family peptidase [Clostridiales bacterium]|jgi:serine protease AprX|nr:S8 family peptidase [Clostridiales bacterium]